MAVAVEPASSPSTFVVSAWTVFFSASILASSCSLVTPAASAIPRSSFSSSCLTSVPMSLDIETSAGTWSPFRLATARLTMLSAVSLTLPIALAMASPSTSPWAGLGGSSDAGPLSVTVGLGGGVPLPPVFSISATFALASSSCLVSFSFSPGLKSFLASSASRPSIEVFRFFGT